MSERVPATRSAPAPLAPTARRRRGFLQTYLTPKASIPPRAVLVLGAGSFVVIVVAWTLLADLIANPFFLPSPLTVVQAEVDMIQNLGFLGDVAWSTFRILAGFLLAAIIAVPLGLLMGSFEAIRAFFQPAINAIRYMPASAFIPLLILLQGLGENEKITVIWIGVFFQLVLMVMDIAQRVPSEMLNVAYTLGATRATVFRKVLLPATWPEVVDVLRITMGWAWTYLIVAELVAANAGIGNFILVAERYFRADRIIAAIISIGILGLMTDYLFGLFHRWAFPYVEKNAPNTGRRLFRGGR
ncbi:MAG TPA: ABC transporter permease [Candidatus Limnocylindrales bacterium]|nr:ABC transporter permease [Candidatus Limnocylindrales bacterium]